jgi:hypothetical protein
MMSSKARTGVICDGGKGKQEATGAIGGKTSVGPILAR